jgi:hypothetical protein
MKKLLLGLLVVVVLGTGTVASASANHGRGGKSGRPHGMHFKTVGFSNRAGRGGVFEKLSGTGSAFSGPTASASGASSGHKLGTGTFSWSISTDWSKAVANRHGGSCAPATGTLSLVGSDTSDTLDASLQGLTCTVGSNSWNIAGVFFGGAKVTSASGALSSITGRGRLLLVEQTDGTVKGFAFAGFRGRAGHALDRFAGQDARHCGGH